MTDIQVGARVKYKPACIRYNPGTGTVLSTSKTRVQVRWDDAKFHRFVKTRNYCAKDLEVSANAVQPTAETNPEKSADT